MKWKGLSARHPPVLWAVGANREAVVFEVSYLEDDIIGLKETQHAAEKVAKGNKIVRWEKEGTNYEAVIEMNGKEWGYKFDAHGKMKGRHDARTEKGEKGEH